MRDEAERGHKSTQWHHREQSEAVGTRCVHLKPEETCPPARFWFPGSGTQQRVPGPQPTPAADSLRPRLSTTRSHAKAKNRQDTCTRLRFQRLLGRHAAAKG